MAVGHELAVLGECLEGLLFEDALGVEVVEDLRLEDEEAAVDVVVGEGLLAEALDGAVVVHVHDPEARQRADRGHGGEAAVRLVERQQRREVDVGQAVAVGDHAPLVADVLLDPLHAPTRHGALAGVGHGDLPAVLLVRAVVGQLGRLAEPDGEVVGAALVVEEEVLDHLAPVAGAHDEVRDAVVGEALHDVPQDRPPADLDHGLGPVFGLFAQAGAESAR